ncbi:PAS domain-containing sensor histidine kinase [Azospirillum brasilense]|uniref:PAS domain-containing sensor histidine kinase n=1 Tax=Azospirillum brasilense TaxID=192 RepID=UPI001EDA4C38|nr:PAS domain-containing sensor histidine kinase [Azospirillum brasilense]UKJ72085.1 PAS domain-containing sensor histidine kinase [Azospirillum brasilense]
MLALLSKAKHPVVDWDALSRRILDQSAQGCWVLDGELITVAVNPALCALLGYRAGELVGTHLLAYVAEESRGVLERQAAIRDLTPHRSYDVTLTRSDGTPLRVIFNDSRLDGEDGGTAPGFCIFVTDITRRFEEEAQRALRVDQLADAVARMNRFLGQICQELKDPLSAILGATQMISSDVALPDPAGGSPTPGTAHLGAYAALCSDAGRQMMRTIENLSLWSRLQLNQVPLELRVYELGGLLQDVLEDLEPRARARDILIVNRIVATPVLGDLSALNTVLKHLIENAVRFSPSGSMVMLSSTLADGRVTVRVQDNGLGIPEELQPHLFRIDPHHTAPGADGEVGSGLGLLICKALIERMGGGIRVFSKPGGGTAVTVTLTPGGNAGL